MQAKAKESDSKKCGPTVSCMLFLWTRNWSRLWKRHLWTFVLTCTCKGGCVCVWLWLHVNSQCVTMLSNIVYGLMFTPHVNRWHRFKHSTFVISVRCGQERETNMKEWWETGLACHSRGQVEVDIVVWWYIYTLIGIIQIILFYSLFFRDYCCCCCWFGFAQCCKWLVFVV